MLRLKYRLTKNKEFERVFATGNKSFSKTLGIIASKNDLTNSRFGIIIGAKISKKATERNRLKRQLREIIRLELNNIVPGYDVVIMALPGLLNLPYPQIKLNLLKQFKQLELLR